ncbi:hypothetical protein R3O67_30550 [Bacillus cereus]|uniref:hypothetical protein n=1 Tax=Bacillus cereus TaxID=1396 RepID=UPI003078C538
MTRCTNCYGKWNALQVWALFFERDGKECPYCLKTQYLSADTLQYFNGIDLRGYFMWMLPVLATLSDKDETCNVLFKDKSNLK